MTLNAVKKLLIQAHPTFFCPISKECLDYRRIHIVKFQSMGSLKTDIISINGYESLTDDQKELFTLVNSLEDL